MILWALLAGCGGDKEPEPLEPLSREELMDPAACKDCHPDHYEQWSGSMHAYAADDPVFLAMEQRGQEETGGELGSFCVDCHAPLAVAEGYVETGADIADAPEHLKGITCYFCHQVVDVTDTHNNPLVLASDRKLRAGIADPVDAQVHESGYSELHDRKNHRSAEMCGSCHDIVLDSGVHLERTYSEWQESLYSDPNGVFGLTCGECHMRGRDGTAANVDGVKLRRVHDHSFPGVDVALTDFPQSEAQLALIQDELDSTLLAALCAQPGQSAFTVATVTLENVAAGHSWPSGASADRRAWVELVAYDGDEIGWSSGLVEPGEPVVDNTDPDLWQIRDFAYNADGEPEHMFWNVAEIEEATLPAPITTDTLDPDYRPTHSTRTFTISGFEPTKIELRVRLRPVGLDFLDDLIESGHLDATVRDAVPTFDLGATELTWTQDTPVGADGSFACVGAVSGTETTR